MILIFSNTTHQNLLACTYKSLRNVKNPKMQKEKGLFHSYVLLYVRVPMVSILLLMLLLSLPQTYIQYVQLSPSATD